MSYFLAQIDYISLIVASGLPSVLLVWLHFRLNNIDKSHKEEMIRLDKKVSRSVREIYESIEMREKNYVLKDTLNAQLNTIDAKLTGINDRITGTNARIGDFVTLMQSIDTKQDSQGERLSKVEAIKD